MTAPFDPDDDTRDGILFRFWIKMALPPPDGSPSQIAMAIMSCITPSDYRTALTELAVKRGVNLP